MAVSELLPLSQLKEAYQLGPWESVRLLPGGKSQHYHISTRRGDYVVRRSYRSKSLDGIRFEHELMAFLRGTGFPAPEIITTVEGDTFVNVRARLYTVSAFMKGSSYQAGNVRQLEEVARALAIYHRLVESFRPSSPAPSSSFLNDSLRQRLAAMPSLKAHPNLLATFGDEEERVRELVVSIPYVLEQGQAALRTLDRLYSTLPALTIHAGCRRGSALFAGDRLIGMLDFDSSHLEVRTLDLAIALHDFAKIYGDPVSPEYKVPLDPRVVSRFLDAYRNVNPIQPAEIEALPALLVAKRLKRALGRYHRLFGGEELSEGDVKKLTLELARVRWLEAHSDELGAALLGRTRRSIASQPRK